MHIGCQPTVKLDCQGGKKKAPFLLLLLAPRGARLQFANVLSGSRGLTVNDLPQKEPAGRGARRTRANPAARTHWPSRAATGSTGTASRLPGPGTSRGSGRRRPRGSHGGHLAGGIRPPAAARAGSSGRVRQPAALDQGQTLHLVSGGRARRLAGRPALLGAPGFASGGGKHWGAGSGG